MTKQDHRVAMARFFARGGYDVEVTADGRVIVDGRDVTARIDADYASGAEGSYIAPTAN
jgi:hypothetical protein